MTQKVCSIAYGPGNPHSDCTNSSLNVRSESRVNGTGSPSVAIKLPEFPQRHSLQNQLCFIITASDEVSTVQVAGTFNAGIQNFTSQLVCNGIHDIVHDCAVYCIILIIKLHHTKLSCIILCMH